MTTPDGRRLIDPFGDTRYPLLAEILDAARDDARRTEALLRELRDPVNHVKGSKP